MTKKGFVAHTNSIIMKTGRKYLVVNWLFVHSPASSSFRPCMIYKEPVKRTASNQMKVNDLTMHAMVSHPLC